MAICLVGIGSNLGNRAETLQNACRLLEHHPAITALIASRWHTSQPVGGPTGQQPFLNGALRLQTSLEPDELLALLQTIEDRLGRTRQQRWEARTLDLDLLLYDQHITHDARLQLPHPRLAFRRFVLEPAVEVAGELVHPELGWTIAQILDHLNRTPAYLALAGPPGTGKRWLADQLCQTYDGHFLADPASNRSTGQPLEREVEFVRTRAQQLAAHVAQHDQETLLVSDYWIDQSHGYAQLEQSFDAATQLEAALDVLKPKLPLPRLIAWLDAPADVLKKHLTKHRTAMDWKIEQLESLRKAFAERFDRGGHGPVLRLDASQPEMCLTELSAAFLAMQPAS